MIIIEHSIIQKWPFILACFNVESWALLSAWVDVYDGTIECWALYNLLSYYSLDIIKTSCKKRHAFSELKSCFSTINAPVSIVASHATWYFLSGAIGILKHFPYKLIVITFLLYTIWWGSVKDGAIGRNIYH